MAKVFETGHAINVAHFEDLISFCTGYATQYNPSKASIKIAALNDLLTASRAAIQNVTNQIITFNNVTNARQAQFEGLKQLATRLVNALQATDAPDKMVDDAKGFNRKIQGTRAKKINENTAPDTKIVSTSQQSYDQQMEHFSKLITLLAAEPSYTPNEIDLQIATLNTQLTNMRSINTATTNAYTDISNARIARNKVLYHAETGVFNTAQEVKKYVKSVFNATSPEYKQISGLRFTTPNQ